MILRFLRYQIIYNLYRFINYLISKTKTNRLKTYRFLLYLIVNLAKLEIWFIKKIHF